MIYEYMYLLVSGNIGGYLGLFLGYAALNIPELLQEAFNWLQRNEQNRKMEAKATLLRQKSA